eukprot:TRINITY_DN5630_c0_g1_i3.p1 TRINITY_DN5630_c0_g1~~TRINITY_DN5630_c0_g1_i3.p1  ORF type:complete len:491 (+),score=53.95 TRINITY_DN5630_c0_g1_i3:69-1475(+)
MAARPSRYEIGVVASVGDQPTIRSSSNGDIVRFAYRIVKRRSSERRHVFRVGDLVQFRRCDLQSLPLLLDGGDGAGPDGAVAKAREVRLVTPATAAAAPAAAAPAAAAPAAPAPAAAASSPSGDGTVPLGWRSRLLDRSPQSDQVLLLRGTRCGADVLTCFLPGAHQPAAGVTACRVVAGHSWWAGEWAWADDDSGRQGGSFSIAPCSMADAFGLFICGGRIGRLGCSHPQGQAGEEQLRCSRLYDMETPEGAELLSTRARCPPSRAPPPHAEWQQQHQAGGTQGYFDSPVHRGAPPPPFHQPPPLPMPAPGPQYGPPLGGPFYPPPPELPGVFPGAALPLPHQLSREPAAGVPMPHGAYGMAPVPPAADPPPMQEATRGQPTPAPPVATPPPAAAPGSAPGNGSWHAHGDAADRLTDERFSRGDDLPLWKLRELLDSLSQPQPAHSEAGRLRTGGDAGSDQAGEEDR